MMAVYILAPLGLLAIYVIFVFNSLTRSKVRIEEAFSDIDVQLKRRYDLIPNLIETVKGYAKHESNLLKEVTEARAEAMKAQKGGSLSKSAAAESALGGAISGLMVQMEAYPELKANQNFLELQKELSDTENKIQAARRFYNNTVKNYNTTLRVFPSNIVAGLFHFEAQEFFEAEEGERENVKVKF